MCGSKLSAPASKQSWLCPSHVSDIRGGEDGLRLFLIIEISLCSACVVGIGGGGGGGGKEDGLCSLPH